LRILMLAHYFPKPGNRVMGTWALAQAQALRRAGAEVRVVSFTSWLPRFAGRLGIKPAWSLCPPGMDWEGLPVTYPRWPLYWSGPVGKFTYRRPAAQARLCGLSARRRLDRVFSEFKPDAVLTHHSLFNGGLARRIKQRHGIPYSVTEHDLDEVRACHKFPARRAVMDRALRSADAVICFSERMKSELEALFPGIATRLIRNGSDPLPRELFSNPRPEAIQGKAVVMSAGIFYERKGFPLLVRAFAKVAARYPNAVLRIAGDGSEKPKVLAAMQETGLGPDRVQLLGSLPNAQVKQEMVWADIFASIGWDEPFATVCIEAASAGKPIIWARDGGINDVLRDGIDGLSVTPRDIESAAAALDRLLGDAELRARMGRSSRETFDRELTWDNHAEQMIRLFRDASRARAEIMIGPAARVGPQSPSDHAPSGSPAASVPAGAQHSGRDSTTAIS
jgi:glycosyltransferase involved in cell wall biosynthesis